MNHHASAEFWGCYQRLSKDVKDLADKSFAQLKADPRHPSLHFKKVGRYWSARVGLHFRAIAVEAPDGLLWLWIGTHADYDKVISQ